MKTLNFSPLLFTGEKQKKIRRSTTCKTGRVKIRVIYKTRTNIKVEAIYTLGGINVYDERTHYAFITITHKRLGSEFGECRFNNGRVRNTNEISVKN